MKKILKFLRNLLWTVLILAMIAIASLEALIYFEVIEMPSLEEIKEWLDVKELINKITDVKEDEEYTVEMVDAKEYFSNNGEIVSEMNVSDAEDVETEADVYNCLRNRGFIEYSVTKEYSMDGNYEDTTDINADSIEQHPMYNTFYCSTAGEFWTITSINGQITANPVSYNFQSELEVSVLISDSEVIISYDNTTNKFYETIPSETALKLIVVDQVDAATLDNLTIGEIDQYVNK